jgi:hypothetical protein
MLSLVTHGFSTRPAWFVDPEGRPTLMRGVNFGGSTKVPYTPDGATHLGVDFEGWRDVSFVGRPAPLDELDRHLDRIEHWGFNVLRFLVTWEAIEHAGPGVHDEAYLDYVRECVRRAGERGLLVFIDPHQDVWSRWTGGDGAPYWTLEVAGMRPERFVAADVVALNALDWPGNYMTAPVATMWTLFYGAEQYAPPRLRGVQEELQSRYLASVGAVAERIADLDNVLGYDMLNEPNGGYIGMRPRDFTRGRRFMARDRTGPEPRTPLEHLAAADAGGIWTDGCPWREIGLWDYDADGRPVLANPDGLGGEVWRDHMEPFAHRFRDVVRAEHPGCFIFLEGSPMDLDTEWRDDDPLVCNARHWYDVMSLITRAFDPAEYRSITGEVVSGAAAIAGEHVKMIAGMQQISRDRMGDPPMLIGEFGIPYEMNDGEAFRTGDWSKQEVALDASYRAMDALLLHSTQWNYTADNTHDHGDQWNDEDLSIFSPDDVTDPSDISSGGRAVRAFCRPYVRYWSGAPRSMHFDLDTGVFTAELEREADIDAPTIVYVPRLHYPDGAQVTVSTGETTFHATTQLLSWFTPPDAGAITLTLKP